MTNHWHRRFIDMAVLVAEWSKDPSTKVGAVIVGPDREVRSTGFNGLPRGIEDTEARLTDRELKLKLVVHAEINAIMNAARHGVGIKGCTMYLAACSAVDGNVWGGPPCTRCTVELIQTGIREIVTLPFKTVPSRWLEDLAQAKALLVEAGVTYTEMI